MDGVGGVLGMAEVGVVGVAGVGSMLAKVPAFLSSSTLDRSVDTYTCQETICIKDDGERRKDRWYEETDYNSIKMT